MSNENKTNVPEVDSSDLFAWTPSVQKTRADQILEAFERFHRKNPSVWNLFERFTLQAIAAGRERYSSDAICHRIRWHTDIETKGESVKINDHYTAYYARLFHVAHPQYDGFFRNRRRISEKHNASGDDRQVFIDQQAGEEKAIQSRLLDLLKDDPNYR